MKASGWFAGLNVIVLMGVLNACLPAQEAELLPPVPQPAVSDGSYEVATRGPLHEAFASPYSSDPIPGVVVDVAPPEPVEELPPEVAPTGENVVWIPGYWGWEPDAQTFIWVSGIWRNVPPGQRWVPGYWTEVDGQYQWVSGFWTGDDTEALVYLPYPPENPEQGPAAAAPGDGYFWVPGKWLWVGNEYQWQGGYWSRAYEAWIWIPGQYVWTPYGCVYTAGYWDYPPTDRGIVFAPVYIRPKTVRTTVVRYTPRVIVQVPRTFVHWFVSPRSHHYYFGNYYGGTYADINLMPWYAYHNRTGYYDPLLTYYRWYYSLYDVDFVDRLRRWHRYYTVYEDRRPPITFAQQREVFSRLDDDVTAGHFRLVQGLDEILDDSQDERRFRRLERERRQQIAQAAEELREVQQLRDRVERIAARQADDRPGGRDGGMRRLELPDQFRRNLRVNGDQDGRQDRIADRRGADGRDGDRPRGRDLAQGRGDQPDRFEDRQRPDRGRDDSREGERVRAARPITPDRSAEDAPREQPGGPDQQTQQPPVRPDQQDQSRGEQGPDRSRPEPGAVPEQPREQQPSRGPRPDEQPDRAERPRRGGPGLGPPSTRGPRPSADRPDEAAGPGQAVQPGQDVQRRPDIRSEDEARRQDGPRRGQPRGFDGRRLPLPRQLRTDRPSEAPPGEEEASARRIPPFSARRGPDGGSQRPGEAAPGRQLGGLGPLDRQPPAVEEDPRARRPARIDRARDAAREVQPRRQPGRGPAIERPDREDDRRGPPPRGNRGRPDRGNSDQPRPQRNADEPDDDEPDD